MVSMSRRLLYCQYGKLYNNLNETVDGLAEYEVSISNSNAVASGGVKVEDDKDNDLAHKPSVAEFYNRFR